MSLEASILKGTALGGQKITFSGIHFDTDPGTVALEGRACVVASWDDGEVVATTPPRWNANGIYIASPDTVDLVLTLADGTAYTLQYAYLVTMFDQALQQISKALLMLDRDQGDNFTVHAGQVLGYKTQDINTGSEWPSFDFFGGEIEYGEGGSDTPYGSDTGTFPFFLRGQMPVSDPANWDFELRALARDMHRAVRKARSTDNVALEIRVDSITPGKFDSETTGGMGGVILTGTIIAKHINVNMNTRTEGE